MTTPTPLTEAEIKQIDHTVIGPLDLCELEDILRWTKRNIKWREIAPGVQSPYLAPDSVSALLARCYSTIWACLAGDISTPYMIPDNPSKPLVLSEEMLTMWEATLQGAEPLGGTWRNFHILSALVTIRALQAAAVAREWVDCADELPPRQDYFDTTEQDEDGELHVRTAAFYPDAGTSQQWCYDDGDPLPLHVTVTAWRERPAPYTPPAAEEGTK